jgi:hypothetical protein
VREREITLKRNIKEEWSYIKNLIRTKWQISWQKINNGTVRNKYKK